MVAIPSPAGWTKTSASFWTSSRRASAASASYSASSSRARAPSFATDNSLASPISSASIRAAQLGGHVLEDGEQLLRAALVDVPPLEGGEGGGQFVPPAERPPRTERRRPPTHIQDHRELVHEELAHPGELRLGPPRVPLRARVIAGRVILGRGQLGQPQDELGLLRGVHRPLPLRPLQPGSDHLPRRRSSRGKPPVARPDQVDDDRLLERVCRRRDDPQARQGVRQFLSTDLGESGKSPRRPTPARRPPGQSARALRLATSPSQARLGFGVRWKVDRSTATRPKVGW